jgi:nicotinamide phosphoribosyltransferase
MGGPYDSAMAGLAHLVFFEGTDTISAIDYAEDYYGANSDEELVGCSVPSTEHSVSCMNIFDAEESFRNTGEWCGYKLEDLI